MRSSFLLHAISTVGLVTVLVVNILANALPINGMNTGEISDQYPSMFTPAGVTFSIWSVIYLMLIGFIVYTWRNRHDPRVRPLLPWFIMTCVLNISWILAWHFLLPVVSVIIMLLLLGTLVNIFLKIRSFTFANWIEKVLISFPFTIYLAWICVATIANISALLVSVNWDGGILTPEIWTVCMMAGAALIAIAIGLEFKTPAFILVIMWALFGIYVRWNDAESGVIPVSAIIMEVILFGALIYSVARKKVI
jgi:benzodiazapine receptor